LGYTAGRKRICGSRSPSLALTKQDKAASPLAEKAEKERRPRGKQSIMFTVEQGQLLNKESVAAFNSALKKVQASKPDLHGQFVMSNCRVALKYLKYIHQIAIDGYSPIAVSLFRTYYEIVCSTMYLAEHKDEMGDFLKFGRRMIYEMGEGEKVKGGILNKLVPDHKELREYFLDKRKKHGGKLPSWHGMTIDDLGKAVGMETYADQQLVRGQVAMASKLVHGDSLLTVLAYNVGQSGMSPVPFAEPGEEYRVSALAATCAMFITLLASVDVGLQIGFKDELDRLNHVWRTIWKEATGVDVEKAMGGFD
jgi:Family of unknown function (DUF5677)